MLVVALMFEDCYFAGKESVFVPVIWQFEAQVVRARVKRVHFVLRSEKAFPREVRLCRDENHARFQLVSMRPTLTVKQRNA